MKFPFNPARGFVLVRADLEVGSGSTVVLRLALDTGASHTVIDSALLDSAGIPVDRDGPQYRVRTATGTGSARRIILERLSALGHAKNDFAVMTYPLSKSLRLDGFLGLDFLRGLELIIDFRNGLIELK